MAEKHSDESRTKQPDQPGVVGFLKEQHAKTLNKNIKEAPLLVELQLEAASDKILFRVKSSDIHEVRLGKSEEGNTRVHLLLKPGSVIDTVVKGLRNIKAIDDPTLSRLTAASTTPVSFV